MTRGRPSQIPGSPHKTIRRKELLRDGSDLAFRRVVNASLAYASRLVAIRDGYARVMGIAGPQYLMLISLVRFGAPEEITVNRLAEHLHLSGSFVTATIKQLGREGLVENGRIRTTGGARTCRSQARAWRAPAACRRYNP